MPAVPAVVTEAVPQERVVVGREVGGAGLAGPGYVALSTAGLSSCPVTTTLSTAPPPGSQHGQRPQGHFREKEGVNMDGMAPGTARP